MNKLKNSILIFFLCLSFSCVSVQAWERKVPVLTQNVETVEEEVRLNFFENFYYRLFEKDTKDFFDYSLLGVFVVGLLIVMVFQNTHYEVVKSAPRKKLLSTENFVPEEEKIEPKESFIEEVEESEILPSELLEEEELETSSKDSKKNKK